MRKIKRFKIPLYHYDIYRKAKKIGLDIDNSHFNGQEGLKEFTSIIHSNIDPCSVFDHIWPDSPLWMRLNIENKQSAATMGFITFSQSFEKKAEAIKDEFEKDVFSLASHMILLSAVNLISDLVQEEAKNDGFILSKPYFLYSWQKEKMENCLSKEFLLNFEEGFLNEILLRLESEKHGVSLNGANLSPHYSAIFLLPWLALKKK